MFFFLVGVRSWAQKQTFRKYLLEGLQYGMK